VDGPTLDLATEASDPDLDTLSYQYSVRVGQIIGLGSKVKWDLTGVEPGSYEVTVLVSDKDNGSALRAINVSLYLPGCCLPPCAALTISGPDEVEEGQSITFTASLAGGEPTVEPTYKWSVSAGTILKGQGTAIIEVDISGHAGQQVTVTLDVGGYPPECQSTTALQVQVRKKSQRE
jgi:hypothetical protein